MSLQPMVPNHTGKSVYATPPQSPTDFKAHDPFANPEEHDGYDSVAKDEEFESSMRAINSLAAIGANGSPPNLKGCPPDFPPTIPQRPAGQEVPPGPTVEEEKPELPPRPVGRDIPLVPKAVKEPPQLPARPPSQPTRRAPKPTPELPNRPPPTPFKHRTTLPPPTIAEETAEQPGETSLKYSRQSERLMAYLIPLPKPNLTKSLEREDDLPEVCKPSAERAWPGKLTLLAISVIYPASTTLSEACQRREGEKEAPGQEEA